MCGQLRSASTDKQHRVGKSVQIVAWAYKRRQRGNITSSMANGMEHDESVKWIE
jgi:hypothetical protein